MKPTPVMPEPCKTCVFREGNPMRLRPGRIGEIQAYLITGTGHLCHTPRKLRRICRGARDWQLMIWHRMGFLAAPTDEALEAARLEHEAKGSGS